MFNAILIPKLLLTFCLTASLKKFTVKIERDSGDEDDQTDFAEEMNYISENYGEDDDEAMIPTDVLQVSLPSTLTRKI